MSDAKDILKKYWGFNNFIEPQQEIIENVLNQENVLVLMPTGFGKSICYQIPSLLLDGVCLVISPLIALMQDQVESLRRKNIKACYIKSNSSFDEIISIFDNVKFGNYKLLYLSPERLQSQLIQNKIKELKISFVAVDEAHCISEWGHDFRPSYRNIKIIKDLHPLTNIIALTATANKRVLNDIIFNLEITKNKIFRKSFYKKNLAYHVYDVEDKLSRLKQIFRKTKTPAIIYVNTRNKTYEIANFLKSKGFKASIYHGGLSKIEKNNSFENWKSEITPIMVATNAFGMGIDKSNVGIVIHFDIPYSLENYIQESGRAGRNKKKSFAVLLKNENDIRIFKNRFLNSLPSLNEIKLVHKKLYQYFEISIGELSEESHSFNLNDFSKRCNISENKIIQILNILDNYNIITIDNAVSKKSKIIFKETSKNVISYAIRNIYIKSFVNSLLRSYVGLFKQEVNIDEFIISEKNKISFNQTIKYLEQLHKDQIINYRPVTSHQEIRFRLPREDDRTINIIKKEIDLFLKIKKQKFESLLNYLANNKVCRSIQLLNYFGEKSTQKCGICDICISEKKVNSKDLKIKIIELLQSNKPFSSSEICTNLNSLEKDVLILLRELLFEQKIKINNQNKYYTN